MLSVHVLSGMLWNEIVHVGRDKHGLRRVKMFSSVHKWHYQYTRLKRVDNSYLSLSLSLSLTA